MLPEAMPLNKAPILQPKANLAPYPISIPPKIAAKKGKSDMFIFELFLPDKFEAINAPNNNPILVSETESVRILL